MTDPNASFGKIKEALETQNRVCSAVFVLSKAARQGKRTADFF